jgi:hypothetical protein
MFYEDLFDIEEEYTDRHKKYASGFSSIFELKREKKFYAMYSAITECHAITIDNKICNHTLLDIKSMKPSDRILEISIKDKLYFFDIESFMEANLNNHSITLKNTKGNDMEIIPVQIRSMITDGRLS